MIQPDLSKWNELIEKYDYEDGTPIFQRLTQKSRVAVPDDYDIINMIVLWKLNRVVHIASETIEYINAVANRVQTPSQAIADPDVRECIRELVNSRGVRLPMASTIMHFYAPDAFAIVDERAYRQACGQTLDPAAGWDVYADYLHACMDLCLANGIPFRQVDKVLYQLDIEEGNRLGRR